MTTAYETLGVSKDASDDDIKKAYRKLASKFHPDKVTDEAEKKLVEVKFKEVKDAFEKIETAEKRARYENPQSEAGFQQFSDMNEILRQMRAAHRMHQVFEFMTQIPLDAAYKGHTIEITLNNVKDRIALPAGIPNGARGQFTSEGGKQCVVSVSIGPVFGQPNFEMKHISDARPIIGANGQPSGEIDTGDLVTTVEVDALDVLLGAWVHITDFLGDKYQVRVPAGFNIGQRLKLKGKGYKNWSVKLDRASEHRADLYVLVKPIFKQPKDLAHDKVQALYDLTRPQQTIDVKV